MHICGTTIRMGHVAGENDVLAVTTDRCMRLGPVTLHAARTSMGQSIDLRSVYLRQHNLILIKLPITCGEGPVVAVIRKELGSRRTRIKKRYCDPRLRGAAAITDMPVRLVIEQADRRLHIV